VLDKIIANRLWWLAINGKLLDSRQLGFQKGMSVSECLTPLDYQTTATLSTRSHLSIISLDLKNTYDKIGIHAIIDEIQRWKIGPKLLNFVSNFLTNRKINVKVSNTFSEDRPLYNRIPQGSPLSVILFLISYNKLCRTIEVHRRFRFFSYADDFTILKKTHKNVNKMSIKSLFTDILSWCDYSGAFAYLPET